MPRWSNPRAPSPAPALDRDAERLFAAMTALLRNYQFRDRDRLGLHGLTITQCYVMDSLERFGSMTLGGLAACMRVDKSTMCRVVAGVIRKGLARRRSHPADHRAVELQLTRAGARQYARVKRDLVAENARILTGFPAPVRRELIRLIQRLTRAVVARELVPVEDPDGKAVRRQVEAP